MAANDNQGLQISLIIFVMLTIILSVSTFFVFKKYQEADAKAKAAETAKQEAVKAQELAEADTRGLKTIAGFQPTAVMDKDIQPAFKTDMESLTIANLPEDKQTYRDALTFLLASYNEKNSSLADARNEIQQLKDAVTTAEAEKQAGIKVAQAEQAKAAGDLAQQTTQFGQDREKFKADLESVRQQFLATTKRFEDLVAEKKRTDDANATKYKKTKLLLDFRNEQYREATASDFEIPDGEVRQIINRNVYINLGSAEGLRAQTLFSVYGNDPNSVVNVDNKKASIEVTKILGAHLSEARILEDLDSDPIVPGDKIESPLFVAGRPQRFAIAGIIDLDKDNVEDREELRRIIAMGGGVVEAEAHPDGRRTGGELNVNTQFLVLGDTPPPAEGGSKEAYAAYVKIRDEANTAGVPIIGLDRFLKVVGWTTPTQSIRYGRGGNSETIRSVLPDGGRSTAPGNVSEIFRQRKPKSVNGSAFGN